MGSGETEGVPPAATQPVMHPVRDRSTVDLMAIVGSVGLFFGLSIQFEWAERLNEWMHGYERWQLDEMPLTLLVLSLGLAWFAWRRWRELSREMQIRSDVEASHQRMFMQNRKLAQQLIDMQETERRHIARELHDEFGQCCVAITVDAALIARDSLPTAPTVHAGALRISETAAHLQSVLRSMLGRLRPTGLDELGLVSSLQLLVENWQIRHGTGCTFQASGALEALDEACTITLYRCVQESLTNIARHAHATQAHVTLALAQLSSGGQRIVLTVGDNGIGLQSPAPQSGMGIAGMRERVDALGGQFMWGSAPTGGTQLQVWLPLARASVEAAA